MLSVVALRSLCVACDCALWSCANNTSATRQNELKTRIFFIFVLRPMTMITRPTAKRFRTKVTNPLAGRKLLSIAARELQSSVWVTISRRGELHMTGMYRRVWLVIAMAFIMLPGMVSAQAGGAQQDDQQSEQIKARQQGQRRLAMLAQRLNLTDDQRRQWMQITRETQQKVRAARKDDSLNEEQMQAQLKEIHKQHNQQIMATLSPEQKEQLKAFFEEQRQKRQQEKASDPDNSNSGPQNGDSNKEKDDDLFAGMVSDDPVPAPPPQNKKTVPK